MMSTQRLKFRAMSGTDSRTPRPISWAVRYTAAPPSWTMPTSKVTRVRSEGFSKIRAISPAVRTRRPASRHAVTRAAAGRESSMPIRRPLPRTSRMTECFALRAARPFIRWRPTRAARAHGTDGDAVGQPLGERHDIRLHAPVLVPPERAGPPQARLDLVQDQERSGLVAELPQAGEIPVVGDVHAPLALDRLQQDCGGPVI